MHHPSPLLSTQESVNAALKYLRQRGADYKLASPVPVIFGNASHGAILRQHRARADRKPVSWRVFFLNLKHA